MEEPQIAVVDQVDPPSKTLHESMVRNGYPVPDYDTFVTDMEDPAKVAALHRSLVAHGKKLPDLQTFSKDMSFGANPSTWGEQQGLELKKKEEAKSHQAGKPFSFGSSVVDAQTAAETYSPDTKASVKEKADRAALSKTYDDSTTIDDVDAQGNDIKADRQLSLIDAYKAYGAATGRADDLQFREQKINSQQYNAETTVMSRLFSPKEQWSGPSDPISAPASRESYNLFKDAYQAKSKIIKNKLDELHDDPISSQMLDGAHEAQDVLSQIAEIEKTGQYNGRPLSAAEYSGIMANKAEYQAHEKAIRSTPQGAAAFKLLDNINSLDADEQRFNQTFCGFIAEDKSASAEQDKVDKLYDDAPWFVKGAYSIGQPVGRAATGFAAKLLTIQDLWTAGDNEYHLSGDQWKDTVNDWKKSIDNELFHQPRSFDEDAFKYEGGSIKLTDDQGRIKPEIKLPTGISVNRGSILPQTTKTFAECIALVAPAGLVSKAAKALGVSKTILGADIGYSVGLVSSSYVSKHDEVFNAALEAGLSREDAAYHARTGALIEASLELVSPQRYLTIGRGVGATVKELAKGAGKTIGRTAGFLAKETGGEVTQETLQSMGDFANQAYRNKTLGKEYFDVSMNKLAKELGQVIPLTAIMAGTTSGAHAMTNPLYSEAVRAAADDPEIIPRLLAEFKKKGTTEVAIKKVLQDIGSVVKYEDGQIGYVNTAHNIPLTKEQAMTMIADGNIGDLNIYGDEEMQSTLEQKHQEQMLKRDQVDQKTATKIVKASDGRSSIVLKSDPTKIVGTIKDGVTTLLDGQGQPATSSAVEEQAPAKHQKIQTIDELIRDNQIAVVDEKQAKLMMADKTNPANSKLGRVITNIQSAMSKINPSGRLVMLNSQEHAVATARKLGYSVEDGATVKGFYDPNTKTAFFVKNPNTTIHEAAIHPIIDMIKHEAPEKYQGFVDEIGSIMSGYDSDGSGRYYLKDAQKNYKGDSKARQSEEAIVSFLADVAAGRFNERTGLEKVVQAVKAFLGLSEKEMMINLSDPQTLQDFAGQIATALSKGQAITIKPLTKEVQKKSEAVKFSKEKADEAGEHNGIKINRTTDALAFHNALESAATARTEDGLQVTVKGVEEYQHILDDGGKLYLSEDNNFGAYVEANGYMGSLFKNPASKEKGVSKTLQNLRIKDGGSFFDAFGTHLEPLYIKNGFEPVARVPFNEEYAPDGWQSTTLKTRPNVVFFAYNPEGKSTVGQGKVFDSWDEAYTFTQDKAHEYEQERTNTSRKRQDQGAVEKTVSNRNDVRQSRGSEESQGEGTSSSEVKFHKEVSETTKRVVEPPTTVFQDLRKQYLHNPQDSTFSTERQSIGDENIRMAAMDDQQALQNMADKGTHELYDIIDQLKATDNFGLLAAIEVMKRATVADDQQLASAVYEKLNKLGSGVGQLLRQMRELKSVYPPSANRQTRMASDRGLIRSIILKKYAKEGIVLPKDMKLALDGLIGNYVAAHELEIAAADKFAQTPTKANSDAHVKAVDYTDRKHYDLIDFVDSTIPAGLGNTIWTIIKGNLLTAGSIGVNTVSNVMNAANQVAIEGPAAAYVGEASKAIAGEKASFNPLVLPQAVGRAMSAFVKAWAPSFREAFSRGSMRTRDLQKFEIQRQLQPAKAFVQAFINPRTLPKRVVNKNGRTTYETPATVWAEKALEGTFGWPAAFFYQMLYLTDKPFKEAGKTFAGYLEYKSQHPRGNASGFSSWMSGLDTRSKAKIERYADKFTYNDKEGMIASAASQVVGSVDKVADWMESLDTPIPVIPTVLRAVKTAVVPYVGVPSNIVQHLLELAFPPAALLSAAYHHRSGEHRIAGMMVGRALTGATLYAVASILSKAGLLIDNDDDPTEKNDVQLKHAVARPAAINLSGLIRLWAGEDTAWRIGDRSIDMQKIGMTGVFLNYYANFSQAMGERRMEDFNANMMDALAQATGSTLKTAFSMSFLKGTFTTLESLAGADKDGAKGMTAFTAKTIETLSNLIWPNALSQLHQAYNQPTLMRAFDPTLLGNVREKMAKRGFYFGVLSTDKLQPVLDIWGAPIPVKPSDILDPSKLEVAADPEAIKVWNLMNETHADNPLTIPMNIIKLSADDNIDGIETDTNMKLDEADYLTLQALVGRYKKAYLRNEFADPAFDGLPNVEKLDIIKEANNDANLAGRELFLDMFYKEIDDGNIVFDAQKGTYYRKTETKFDSKANEQLIAADGSEIPQN